MALTAIEIIASLFAIIGLVKLAVILIDKKKWLPVVRKVYENPKTSNLIVSLLALVVFYYLIQDMTIVQIFAVVAFTSLLIAIAFMKYSNEILKITKKVMEDRISIGMWIYIIIWVFFMLWVLYEVFF